MASLRCLACTSTSGLDWRLEAVWLTVLRGQTWRSALDERMRHAVQRASVPGYYYDEEPGRRQESDASRIYLALLGDGESGAGAPAAFFLRPNGCERSVELKESSSIALCWLLRC
jgi:hypothetical protein